MNVPVFMRVAVFTLAVVAIPVAGSAQAAPELQSAAYVLTDRDGRTVGVYEISHVVRDEGLFATSKSYKGAKAATQKKRGTPAVRSYLETTPDKAFSKYTRWVTEGTNVREFKMFRYGKDIKMRVAVGANGKVSVVGKWQNVHLIEPDQPYTAAVLVDRAVPEKQFACINTTLGKVGKAHLRVVGVKSAEAGRTAPAQAAAASPDEAAVSPDEAAAAPEAAADAAPVAGSADVYEFRLDGDCGQLNIWQDGLGNFVKFQNADTTWTPLVR
jgi:hypothetical protein